MVRKVWIGAMGLALCLALGGCQLPGGSGASSESSAEDAKAGPDDPRPKPRPGSEAAKAAKAANSAAPRSPDLEPPAPARTPDADDDLLPQADEAKAEAAEEKPSAPELPDEIYQAPEPPPVPAALTGQAAQCTKTKGRFVQRGEGGTFTCVRPTRDANKSCDDSSDCEGLCFAKSRTCAPATPLFGCYDALESGRVVKICTE
ncbi:hypothetical protein FHY55_16430 [Oceanicola sp. D3]|uniref:hypothetical protein n=1 Tax=Oceanicola sp. D3 TaxID=2587163 RepID=UPI00111EB51F|nr:hypothetical protein [Oceanicola sp. D3]QDC10719.1 hypothetical protein FHY55_16430 [Oceanicola sp. D3]